MEAARVAASRGHQVTLIEKSSKLGGQLNVAGLTPSKGRCIELRDQLEACLHDAGVKILLNTEYTPELAKELQPDEIAVACGATPRIPDFPGVDSDIVVTAEDLLASGRTDFHDAVILGGGEVAVETAEHLLRAGVENVTVIARGDDVMRGCEAHSKRQILLDVLGMSCDIRVCTQVLEIGDSWVLHERKEAFRFDGPEKTPADVVVLATGYVAAHPVIEADVPVHILADSDSGNILESIAAGAKFGMMLGIPDDKKEG